MNKLFTILCLLVMFNLPAFAQVGIGTTSPDGSAILDVMSSTKGLLAPRMTTAERTGIASPADGLLVYDTDTHSFWYYKSSAWSEFLGNTSGWSLAGNSLTGTEFLGSANSQPVKFYSNNTERMRVSSEGNVGISTTNPQNPLHVYATSNPLRLEGLQTGTSTDVLVTDANGVVQKRSDLSGMKFGDATNNATFEPDGTLVFNGNSTVFNDFVVPLSAAKAGGNSPTWEKFRDNGSGSVGVFTWTFADVGTNSENEIHFTVQMPHGWKQGSAIEPHIHWAPMTNGTGVVRWGMEYTWVDYQGNFSNTTVVYGNSTSVSSNQYTHLITSLGQITPSASQDNISSVLMIRFFRNSGNAADTYPDKAAALSFDIHYETDMLGSRTQYAK